MTAPVLFHIACLPSFLSFLPTSPNTPQRTSPCTRAFSVPASVRPSVLPLRVLCLASLPRSAIISLLSPEARFLNEDHLNISFVSAKNELSLDALSPARSRARSTYDGGGGDVGGIKVARPSPLLQKRHRPKLFVQSERAEHRPTATGALTSLGTTDI